MSPVNLSTSEVLMNLELTPQQLAAVKAELIASGEVLDISGHAKTVLTLSLLHELERSHVSYLDPDNYTRHNAQGAASAVFVVLDKVNPAAAKSFREWHRNPMGWSTGYETKCSCQLAADRKHEERMALREGRKAEKEATV